MPSDRAPAKTVKNPNALFTSYPEVSAEEAAQSGREPRQELGLVLNPPGDNGKMEGYIAVDGKRVDVVGFFNPARTEPKPVKANIRVLPKGAEKGTKGWYFNPVLVEKGKPLDPTKNPYVLGKVELDGKEYALRGTLQANALRPAAKAVLEAWGGFTPEILANYQKKMDAFRQRPATAA